MNVFRNVDVSFYSEDLVPLEDCLILFTKEIFKIEKAGSQIREGDGTVEKRKS